MKVFVAGASGAVGIPTVDRLVAAGHTVSGTTRSRAKAERLRKRGVEPMVCDALDGEALRRAVVAAEPEVVINQLTALPNRISPRKPLPHLAVTNRLRREATPVLVDAAVEVGARRVVSQSIAFMYAPDEPDGADGKRPRTEDDPVYRNAPDQFVEIFLAALALEEATVGSDDVEGVVLRYGFFYGPGTYYDRGGAIAEDVARRRFPIVGGGNGVHSFVHVDDAAAAAVAALDAGESGIYNVVDDDPAPVREWLPFFAECLGAPPPRRIPAFVARWLAGPYAYYMAVEAPGASNARACRELGWRPRYETWRQGFRAGLGELNTAH